MEEKILTGKKNGMAVLLGVILGYVAAVIGVIITYHLNTRFLRKRKEIRTLRLPALGSDFYCLVRVRGLEPPRSCPH